MFVDTENTKRPDALKSLRHIVNNYLPNGPVGGLNAGVNASHIDTNYVREKIELLRKTADSIENDLNILVKSQEEQTL